MLSKYFILDNKTRLKNETCLFKNNQNFLFVTQRNTY